MSNKWQHEADIEEDLYQISEFCPKNLPKRSVPPSKYMKSLIGKSIFDDFEDDDEFDEPQCKPVRGYPIHKQQFNKPGGLYIEDNPTSLQIRQVSGFGYSNDLIEHALKSNGSEESEDSLIKMQNLTFRSTSNAQGLNFKHILDTKSGNVSDTSSVHSASTNSPQMHSVHPEDFHNFDNKIDINNHKEFPSL